MFFSVYRFAYECYIIGFGFTDFSDELNSDDPKYKSINILLLGTYLA